MQSLLSNEGDILGTDTRFEVSYTKSGLVIHEEWRTLPTGQDVCLARVVKWQSDWVPTTFIRDQEPPIQRS